MINPIYLYGTMAKTQVNLRLGTQLFTVALQATQKWLVWGSLACLNMKDEFFCDLEACWTLKVIDNKESVIINSYGLLTLSSLTSKFTR